MCTRWCSAWPDRLITVDDMIWHDYLWRYDLAWLPLKIWYGMITFKDMCLYYLARTEQSYINESERYEVLMIVWLYLRHAIKLQIQPGSLPYSSTSRHAIDFLPCIIHVLLYTYVWMYITKYFVIRYCTINLTHLNPRLSDVHPALNKTGGALWIKSITPSNIQNYS